MNGILANPQFEPREFIGKEVNNVTLMELIGRGAMGAVYVGYQKSLKRKVAIKIFPKEAAADGCCHIQFRDEAEIVSGLIHPNIVTIFDMGETDQFLFITMQLVSGEDLRSLIHRHQLHPVPARRTIDLYKVMSIMLPVLDALAYAHEEGVVHQDIKPGNILIEERTGRSFLADFGIARSAMNAGGDESSMVMGTPLYIAPEQLSEDPGDPRADIYSAGTVLYEAIAGKLPFQKTTVEALLNLKMNNPTALYTLSPSQVCPVIDGSLEKIILKSIAPAKGDRFQTCRDFHRALSDYSGNRFKTGTL